MKKVFTVFIIICFCQAARAQFANTNWTGTITAGGSTINILWNLAADTSFFYNNDDNTLLDVSVYKVQDSTLSLKKVSGLSSCDEEEGIYKFVLNGNDLMLYLSKDSCTDRSEALDKSIFTKK